MCFDSHTYCPRQFVTTYGLKKNMYRGTIQSEVVLDDLFAE